MQLIFLAFIQRKKDLGRQTSSTQNTPEVGKALVQETPGVQSGINTHVEAELMTAGKLLMQNLPTLFVWFIRNQPLFHDTMPLTVAVTASRIHIVAPHTDRTVPHEIVQSVESRKWSDTDKRK